MSKKSLFDRINCIIGDNFFFYALEETIKKSLMKTYSLSQITKEFVFDDDNAEKLNKALFPNIFDIEPKIVILRNVKNKFISYAIDNLETTKNIYLIIEIEKEKYDARVKVFKELEKNKCIHFAGFAFYDKDDILLNIAFNKMEELLEINIPNDIRQFIINYVPKTEYDNKPIHNLNRIYYELKKISSINKTITLDSCKNLITYQQIYYNIFDISQALENNDLEKILKIIDTCVVNIGDAKQLLSFILSEIKIICSIQDKINMPFNILYKDITENSFKYEMLDDSEKQQDKKILHPYRLKKILEKKNSSYFKNCHNNLKLCLNAYNDLNYYYYDNFKVPIVKLCLNLINS